MGTEYYKCAVQLQQELDDAKLTLVSLNDNIRRIIGRRSDNHPKLQNEKKRIDETAKYKRRCYDTKSVFNRLSGPPSRSPVDEEARPRMHSRVIRELPTREDIVTAQGTDSESRARNRRMFGSLLGTLQKFCQEESRLKQKEEKKAQIEKKVEEQEIQARATLRKERELLFIDRRKKQIEIRMLELKMSRIKDFENWEHATKSLKYHLRTNTKPYIYFKPRILCKKTEKLLHDNETFVNAMIEKKREALNKELSELEKNAKSIDFETENNDNFTGVFDFSLVTETAKSTNQEIKSELQQESNDVIQYEVSDKKGDLDSKENKSRNSNEPSLNSSIIVVKRPQSERK